MHCRSILAALPVPASLPRHLSRASSSVVLNVEDPCSRADNARKMDAGQLQAYAAITLCAVVPIYAGSYGSVRKPKTAKSKQGARKLDEEDESEDEEDLGETLTVDDGLLLFC